VSCAAACLVPPSFHPPPHHHHTHARNHTRPQHVGPAAAVPAAHGRRRARVLVLCGVHAAPGRAAQFLRGRARHLWPAAAAVAGERACPVQPLRLCLHGTAPQGRVARCQGDAAEVLLLLLLLLLLAALTTGAGGSGQAPDVPPAPAGCSGVPLWLPHGGGAHAQGHAAAQGDVRDFGCGQRPTEPTALLLRCPRQRSAAAGSCFAARR
jgi:hypothetical protein